MKKCKALFAVATLFWGIAASGQTSKSPNSQPSDATFRLGAGDVVKITAVEAEEISKEAIRISSDGYINLTTVGRLKAADLTVEELQFAIGERLKRLIVNPDVSVSVVESHSQPVSVLGAVRNPGVIQLQGRKTLIEVMSLAGGLREDAGYVARITRQKEYGPLPLRDATDDPTGEYSVAQVNLQRIIDAQDPGGNILMMPNDLISVPKAQMVYVIGDVNRPSGIALGDQKTVTVLQAIGIVSGLTKTAKSTDARILRINPGSTTRVQVTVNLKTMLSGKTADVPLQPEDILFVPNSLRKDLAYQVFQSLGGAATTPIYRIP
jgi:polysaccharide export outer membrane protein